MMMNIREIMVVQKSMKVMRVMTMRYLCIYWSGRDILVVCYIMLFSLISEVNS